MISYIMNTKNCMSVLLLSDRFDSFSFIGGEITKVICWIRWLT